MTFQHAMAQFRAIVQATFLQYRSRACPVRQIPPEIVGMIFAFLSMPDQICFSLSCKYILACLQGIRLSHLLPPEKRPVLSPHAKNRSIVQLLHQLEDDRWRYCSECWTLHPRHTPLLVQTIRRLRERSHCLNCLLARDQFCYHVPYIGEVDICPCLTITFRDKLHLMESCKRAREAAHEGREYYYNNVLYHPSYGKLEKRLWHDCTFTKHPFVKVQVQTTLWIEESTIRLYVKNIYKFKISQDLRISPSSIRRLPCPHKDVASWLGRFFAEAGSSFRGWGNKSPWHPSFKYWDDLESTGGPRPFEITVVRDLGDREWPNKSWDGNCCN